LLFSFVRKPAAVWRTWPAVLHLWWYPRGFTTGLLRSYRRRWFAVPTPSATPPEEFRPLAPVPSATAPASNRSLNVALLCHSFGSLSNGINVYTLHLAEALTARGHSVTIVRAAGGAPMPAKGPRYRIVDVEAQGRLYQAAVGQRVYAASTYQPFDVVESPLWLGEGCALGMLVSYPLVVRLMTPTEVIRQTSELPLTQALHASIVAERLVVHQAAGLIAISKGVRQTVEKVFDLRLTHAARQLAVIPLGLPSARSVKKARVALPSTVPPRLLFIGRLEGRKGVLELGEAFLRLGQANRKASLWIVGQDNSQNDGFQRKTGTNYVEALRGLWGPELSRRVHFFGPIDEDAKNYLLSQCDFLVAPSRYESFGLILLEAMRFGKAVVATAVGGMPEIVADGKTGLLVPGQAPAELAAALLRLCEDNTLRDNLGKAALERFHQEFEIGKCADRSVQFYRQVIDQWHDTMLTSFPPSLRTLATARSSK
jgi:glycogen synthase